MRLHWRVLGAGGMIGLFNDRIRLRETLVNIPVANAETMADVGTGLRAHSEVSGIVVGNGVLIVNKHRTFRGGLDRVKKGGDIVFIPLATFRRLPPLVGLYGGAR